MGRGLALAAALATATTVAAGCDTPRAPTDPPGPPGAGRAADTDDAVRMSALRSLRDPSGQPIAPQLLASRLLVVNFWSPF